MVFFPKHTAYFYEEIEDGEECGYDNYGLPQSCDVLIGVTIGDFQEYSQSDARREYGEEVNGAGRIYIPFSCQLDIGNNAKVIIDGDDRIWRVSGQPIKRSTLIPHIKINLLLETKQIDEGD